MTFAYLYIIVLSLYITSRLGVPCKDIHLIQVSAKYNKHRFVQKVAKKIILLFSFVFSANIGFLH